MHRRCRDVLCLLFFIAFWAGMFVICGVAFKNGGAAALQQAAPGQRDGCPPLLSPFRAAAQLAAQASTA